MLKGNNTVIHSASIKATHIALDIVIHMNKNTDIHSYNNTVHSFFYKNVIFRAEAQNFLKNPDFSLKKLLVLTLFPGWKLS